MTDWRLFAEPCPECGGTEFYEQRLAYNVVECDETGEPEAFRPESGSDETQKVWCRGCDALLFDAEEPEVPA